MKTDLFDNVGILSDLKRQNWKSEYRLCKDQTIIPVTFSVQPSLTLHWCRS